MVINDCKCSFKEYNNLDGNNNASMLKIKFISPCMNISLFARFTVCIWGVHFIKNE